MFQPSRLRVARHRRGLTFSALASLVDLSTKSLSAYEQGTTTPEPETVRRLALALRFPETFFRAAALFEPTENEASFRSLASMTASQRDSALAGGALAIDLSRWIEKRFKGLPTQDIPDLRGLHPELAAEHLRSAWGLGDKPLRNCVHLLEQHGCRVFSLAEDTRTVDAFSLWHEDVPFVFLNTMKSSEHSRMDAAHELGHLAMHRGEALHTPEQEADAQRFAAAFLMPRARMLSSLPRAPKLDALIPHKRYWGVSLAGLVYEAKRLGLLTEWQYRTLFVELSKRGYRRQERDGWPRESSQVLQKMLAHLRQREKSLRDVARDLNVEPFDLEVLVFGLAFFPIEGGGDGSAVSSRPKLRSV